MKKTDVYADFHVHTHISPCGKPDATAQAMIQRASEKGFAALGFADHFTPQPVPGCRFYDPQRLDILTRLRNELALIQVSDSLDVLVGVEADYTLAGAGCLDDNALRECDQIICAASHFHLPAAPLPTEDTAEAKAELIVRMGQEMLEVPGVSVWAHPFDCSKMRPLAPIMAMLTEGDFVNLINRANHNQVAVEINGGPGVDPEYRQSTAPFFLLAREMGARFTLTADAHHPDDFERLDIAWDWAERMGFRGTDFLTAGELRARQQIKVAEYFARKIGGKA